MSTLNQIIYNIRNTADGGISQRAQRYSDRQIAYWVQAHRNRLIYEDFERTSIISPLWEQDLGCVKLTEVDKADCKTYQWGDNVKKATLPEILKLPHKGIGLGGGLTFVGLLDKQTRIPIDVYGRGQYDNFVMYAPKKRIKAYIIGNVIYVDGIGNDTDIDIFDEDGICAINVRGIFAASNDVCRDWAKDQYPIDAHLEEVLYQKIWTTELSLAAQSRQDKTNNDNGDDNL